MKRKTKSCDAAREFYPICMFCRDVYITNERRRRRNMKISDFEENKRFYSVVKYWFETKILCSTKLVGFESPQFNLFKVKYS
jgi:hypothetical protein